MKTIDHTQPFHNLISWGFSHELAKNPATHPDTLDKIIKSNWYVNSHTAANHPSAKRESIEWLMNNTSSRIVRDDCKQLLSR